MEEANNKMLYLLNGVRFSMFILNYMFFFLAKPWGLPDLSSPPWEQGWVTQVKVQSPNH